MRIKVFFCLLLSIVGNYSLCKKEVHTSYEKFSRIPDDATDEDIENNVFLGLIAACAISETFFPLGRSLKIEYDRAKSEVDKRVCELGQLLYEAANKIDMRMPLESYGAFYLANECYIFVESCREHCLHDKIEPSSPFKRNFLLDIQGDVHKFQKKLGYIIKLHDDFLDVLEEKYHELAITIHQKSFELKQYMQSMSSDDWYQRVNVYCE